MNEETHKETIDKVLNILKKFELHTPIDKFNITVLVKDLNNLESNFSTSVDQAFFEKNEGRNFLEKSINIYIENMNKLRQAKENKPFNYKVTVVVEDTEIKKNIKATITQDFYEEVKQKGINFLEKMARGIIDEMNVYSQYKPLDTSS